MDILLVSATPFEIAPALSHLETHFLAQEPGRFEKNGVQVTSLITGIGLVATSWRLGRHLSTHKAPQWVINAGIAGAFDQSIRLGEVVQVSAECFGDLGVEEADGQFTDLFQLGLNDPFGWPFTNGELRQPDREQAKFLPTVSGLSVNRVHGYAPSIESIRRRYPHAQIETMEGAAFFYACLMAGVPFIQIRSISNYVESRNRDNWQIGPAIENLNEVLVQILESLAANAGSTPPAR